MLANQAPSSESRRLATFPSGPRASRLRGVVVRVKSQKRVLAESRNVKAHPSFGAAVGLLAAGVLCCVSPSGDAARESSGAPKSGDDVVQAGADPAAREDPWRGLARHEIQFDQKLLVVTGSKGVIGCPYLNVGTFERFGEACAIIPATDTAGMLDAHVTAVTSAARALGIEVGMSGREALDKIR